MASRPGALLALLACLAFGAFAGCDDTPDEHVIDASDGGPDAEAGSPDATPDAIQVNPCDDCGVGAICVQRFDGVCTEQLLCVETAVRCPDNVCSAACEAALCGGDPYQCETRPPCGTEVEGAFTCYGP